MRRVTLILGTLAALVCIALIFRAAGQFVESQSAALKDRTTLPANR